MGTLVSITGSNFLNGATVHFGENEGVNVSVNSSNSISATTPPTPGLVSVIVATTNASVTIYMDLRLKSPRHLCQRLNWYQGVCVKFEYELYMVWFRTFESVFMTSTNLGMRRIGSQ